MNYFVLFFLNSELTLKNYIQKITIRCFFYSNFCSYKPLILKIYNISKGNTFRFYLKRRTNRLLLAIIFCKAKHRRHLPRVHPDGVGRRRVGWAGGGCLRPAIQKMAMINYPRREQTATPFSIFLEHLTPELAGN